MNIVFLSTADSGGAGKAAYSIYSTLKKYHECKFIVFRKDTTLSDVQEIRRVKKGSHFLHWLLNKIKDKISLPRFVIDQKYDMLNLMETAPYLNLKKLYSVVEKKPDLIILNWVSGFINSRDIKDLYKKYQVPLIWFLHDYAPLTGGCHIAWNCLGFTKSCGNCPGLNSTSERDYTNRIHKNKSKNLLNIPVFTTGWSDFILNKSHQSSLFMNKTLIPISPAIDSTIFSPPNNKNKCKEMLNIPPQYKVVLFGSQNIFSEYKGFNHLISALNILNEYLLPGINFCLVTFGKANEMLKVPIKYAWINLGETSRPSLLYQAADVFTAPTLQDTGPMTVCESLMCGTPIIGYPMGIIPNLVREGDSGYIVEEGNTGLLAKRIAQILNLSEPEYKELSKNCRTIALEKCSESAQLKSLGDIFKLLKFDQIN